MRIYSVFHKKLLELAPLDAELAMDIELEDDEYEVEEVKDLVLASLGVSSST